MYCSTSLQISPIIPRLPRALAFLLILSLLIRTGYPVPITQREWLPVVTALSGHWHRRKVCCYCVPSYRWRPLLSRLLARCALLGVLLYSSGWFRMTPLSWGLLLLPIAQVLVPRLVFTRPKRMVGGHTPYNACTNWSSLPW
jgi:hypothetical protein